jgi:hypothetical protein
VAIKYTVDVVITSDNATRVWSKAEQIETTVGGDHDSGMTLQKPFTRDLHWSFNTKSEAEVAKARIERLKPSKDVTVAVSIGKDAED